MAVLATVWLYRTGQRSVLTAEISAQEWDGEQVDGRKRGEAGDRTKGRLTTSKDITWCTRESGPAECPSSWAFPQASYLTTVSPHFCRSFVARLGQARRKHCYIQQDRTLLKILWSLVVFSMLLVTWHPLASHWAPYTHITNISKFFMELRSWTSQSQRELDSLGTWGSVGVHFNPMAVPSHTYLPPVDRHTHVFTSCCGCIQTTGRQQSCLGSVHFANTWVDWKIASGL